jgi:hypothetical protein
MLETAHKIEMKIETSSDTDHMKSASGQRPKMCPCKTRHIVPLKEHAEYIQDPCTEFLLRFPLWVNYGCEY